MSLISKDAVQAAFDNADADVMADYGPEQGAEWGFSRSAVNRILTTAFASEKHFEPGQEVWIVERNEDGEACEVGGYVFLAKVAGYAILSPYVNGDGDLKYLLDYHRRDTCADYDADLPVVFLKDCYPSQEAAHHSLDEEVGEDDC